MEQNKDDAVMAALEKTLKPSAIDYIIAAVATLCAVLAGGSLFVALYSAHPQAAVTGLVAYVATKALSFILELDYAAKKKKVGQLLLKSMEEKLEGERQNARQD